MIAVQVARALGAEVTALASQRDHEFVTRLGAHHVMDYKGVTPSQLGPFDVIFDTSGKDLLAFRRRLHAGGRMITIDFGSARAMVSIAFSSVFGKKRIRTFSGYPDRSLLDDVASYVKSGGIWPVVDTIYPLQNIAAAHRALGEPGHQGKLVLTPTSPTSAN